MTTIATRRPPVAAWAPRSTLGLSGRLILLTLGFVMLAEVLVYLPSVASYRRSLVSDRFMGAQMIVLALSATPPENRSNALETRLLEGIRGAHAVGVRGSGTDWLLAKPGQPLPEISLDIDLRNPIWWGPLRGALRSLVLTSPGYTRILGPGIAGVPGMEWVELIVDEAPLRRAAIQYTWTFLLVSWAISAVTGAVLYLALHVLVVRPVRRLSSNITAFANDPEDAGRVISPTGRSDEIGLAEEALARMETALARELRQKQHLADLGLAVSKINHELRNMLTTAQLLGDRLDGVEDPTVRRVAPRLVRTLARAVDFCAATLEYGRATEPAPQRRRLALRPVVEEQLDLTALAPGRPIAVTVEVSPALQVDADPDQLGRILLNLLRNAVEALARDETPEAAVSVEAARRDGTVLIRVRDNGPGIPERTRERLFSAFQASDRAGGTGLGLPVADQLARLHGGRVTLEDSPRGASFVVTVPDRAAAAG